MEKFWESQEHSAAPKYWIWSADGSHQEGEMATRRMWFHAATIISGRTEKMFALGGYDE